MSSSCSFFPFFLYTPLFAKLFVTFFVESSISEKIYFCFLPFLFPAGLAASGGICREGGPSVPPALLPVARGGGTGNRAGPAGRSSRTSGISRSSICLKPLPLREKPLRDRNLNMIVNQMALDKTTFFVCFFSIYIFWLLPLLHCCFRISISIRNPTVVGHID